MTLYSCHEIPGAGYAMHKFDNDLNPEGSYEVTNATCTCPAGVRPTCKHRSRLLPAFLLRKHIGDGWFLNDQNMMWHRPVSEVHQPLPQYENAGGEADQLVQTVESEAQPQLWDSPDPCVTGSTPILVPRDGGFKRRV